MSQTVTPHSTVLDEAEGDFSWEAEGTCGSAGTGLGTLAVRGRARTLAQTGAVLSRKERLQVFGIDCTGPFGDGILFKGGEWNPGNEYIQRLRVKNISAKLKKLKYRLPTTKFFSLAYPEIITLSPGTIQEVDVIFRPMSSEVYDDVILFKVLDGPNAGGFNVPVRALLPTLQVSIPFGLDFGYCQTDDVSERVFYVHNTGEVPAPFLWDVPPPFRMSPAEGVIAVGESKAATCSIRPIHASVFVSQAVLRVGQGVNAIKPKPLLEMKVSAVGKYCYVVPSEDEVDFGSQTVVVVGGASGGRRGGFPRKCLTLRNQSVVPASFKIRRVEEDRDAVFTAHPSEGVIPPEDEVTVTITYSPFSAGTFSRDHYEITTVGGNKVIVAIQGRAVGCSVRLEKKEDPFARGCGVPDSVNFRDVKVGVTTSRVIYLYNESNTPCRFCFAIQGDSSIFRFSCTRGSIPSTGTEHPGETQITLTFTPNKPTNYYRRIFCLLENQHPLVMDAMGTGYVVAKGEVQEQRPAPLRHAHVQAFRNRENMGLGGLSAEELDDILKAEGMSDLFAKVGPQGTLPLEQCRVARPLTRSGEATRVQTATAAEFFVDPADQLLNKVYLDRSSVDFGFSVAGGEESIALANNTNTEVHVVWNLGLPEGDKPGEAGLRVTPLEADVPAKTTFMFRLGLFPTKSNCYFSEEAEAFVSPSNQMTFRTVKDATQQPPWCLPIFVRGHTFVGEQFLVKASLSTQYTDQKLCFPACHVGDTVYQTIRLSNQGNIPACFSFQPDPTCVFDIKPAAGLVPAGDFQLCLVRFIPPGTGESRHRLACTLNNDPGSTQEVELFGQGEMPAIQAIRGGEQGEDAEALSLASSSGLGFEGESDGRIFVYLRPTCVGIVSAATFKIKNPSRIPVIFTIEPPKASSGVLRVFPLAGFLLGNQTATLQVVFAPRETKKYRFRLPVKVRAILKETPHLIDCRQLREAVPAVVNVGAYVVILGQGERGAVTFHPDSLAYSVRLVNTPESKVMVLENCSECDVAYKLFYLVNKEPPSRRSSRESTIGESGELTRTPDLRPMPKENGEAKGQGGPNTLDVFFVDKPDGTLPARSRTRTIATFRPVSEGEYDFAILCQVTTTTGTGDDNAPSALQTDMLEQGHKARVSAARLGEMRVAPVADINTSEKAVDGNPDSAIMPLKCSISGRASFPTVVFRDVRMTKVGGGVPGASPRNLWSALSLSTINDMLSKPLSEEEVRFNQESSPDTSQLPRFHVPFAPAVIGSGPVVITLQVCNPGFLQTSVTVNLPNAKTVEMETWANEGEPTAEELRQNDIIDRLKAFTFDPDPGTVMDVSAGEAQPLRIVYSADSLTYRGIHDLPMLVRIKEGRQFWLDLKGTTLPSQSALLYVPTGLQREYILEPVAIGTPLAEAPLQTTELLNVGEAKLSYRVDGQAIKRANNTQGHGVTVFRLEEKTGTISGGGSAFLRWRFVPLEAKEYVLRVTIRVEEKLEENNGVNPEEHSVDITLKGIGYDPRKRDPHSEVLPPVDLGLVPPAGQMEIPRGQPCILGVERLRLGRILQGAVFSRVVSIRNCLAHTAVEFSWDPSDTGLDTPLLSSGVVSIRPLKGRLDATQTLIFQVAISAACGPRFLGQHLVACLIRQVPPGTARRSRKPKSRLENRMEEERQARARPPDPRVPIVSRPTAARTQHMAETAKTISTRNSSGNSGRILSPHYPTSTLSAPIPRVLAEALALGTRESNTSEGGLKSSPKWHSSDGDGGANARSSLDGGANEVRLPQGIGGGTLNLVQTPSRAKSNGPTEAYNQGGDGPNTDVEDGCLLRMAIEGEVVCAETYYKVSDRIGATHNHSNAEDFDGQGKRELIDAFLVPRPPRYVPDWAAFGPRQRQNGKNAGSKKKQGVRVLSARTSVAKTGGDTVQQLKQQLTKSASQDPLTSDVASRVLKRLVEDVVASYGVRGCFDSLPPQLRVSTFGEIQNTLPLPDRMVAALAPFLQGSLRPQHFPRPPTAAAAAVSATRRRGMDNFGVNRNTPLHKGCLITALETAGIRMPRSTGKGGQREKATTGVRKKKEFAKLLATVEALPGIKVTISNVVSNIDNKTVISLERWLERTGEERQNCLLANDSTIPKVSSTTPYVNARTGVNALDPAFATEKNDSRENLAALAIQSQARRRQAVQLVEKAAQERLLRLADKAFQNAEAQRTVATALEGTFFNLIQEAFHREFDLNKRPTRFAIQKNSTNKAQALGRGVPDTASKEPTTSPTGSTLALRRTAPAEGTVEAAPRLGIKSRLVPVAAIPSH